MGFGSRHAGHYTAEMLPDYGMQLLAQTTIITERHDYVYAFGRRIEISPSALMAGLALIALVVVAVVVSFLIYRSRLRTRAKE